MDEKSFKKYNSHNILYKKHNLQFFSFFYKKTSPCGQSLRSPLHGLTLKTYNKLKSMLKAGRTKHSYISCGRV